MTQRRRIRPLGRPIRTLRFPQLQSLRAAVVAVLVLSTLTMSTLIGAALVATSRANIYQARQDTLLTQFRDDSDSLFDTLDPSAGTVALQYQAQQFPGRTALIDLRTGTAIGELPRRQIPDTISAGWSDPSGAVRYLRATLNGNTVFFVGTVTRNISADPSAHIALVTAYTLQPQRHQIDRLATTAAVIGGIGVVVAVIAGIWFGTVLTRPIHRLAGRARALGSGSKWRPMRTRFADVADVAHALEESSAALEQSIAELQRREGHARRLVSDVAHELRTPLTSMVAVGDILTDLEHASDEDRDVAVAITTRGTERLTALVDELLELSRLDAGVVTVRRNLVVLHAELQRIMHLVDPLPTEDSVHCAPGAALQTDPVLFRKIVSNLVTNAYRHGAPPVRVYAAVDEDWARIDVVDSGPGVHGPDADRIFERFTVADASRRDPRSTGLGLAIARDAARLLGGELQLRTDTVSTTFTVTLPTGGAP